MKKLRKYYRTACFHKIEHPRDWKASISNILAPFQSSLGFFDNNFLVLNTVDKCKSKQNLLDPITQSPNCKITSLTPLVTSSTEKNIESKTKDHDAISRNLQGAM